MCGKAQGPYRGGRLCNEQYCVTAGQEEKMRDVRTSDVVDTETEVAGRGAVSLSSISHSPEGAV